MDQGILGVGGTAGSDVDIWTVLHQRFNDGIDDGVHLHRSQLSAGTLYLRLPLPHERQG